LARSLSSCYTPALGHPKNQACVSFLVEISNSFATMASLGRSNTTYLEDLVDKADTVEDPEPSSAKSENADIVEDPEPSSEQSDIVEVISSRRIYLSSIVEDTSSLLNAIKAASSSRNCPSSTIEDSIEASAKSG
jgi:hypothetical protein